MRQRLQTLSTMRYSPVMDLIGTFLSVILGSNVTYTAYSQHNQAQDVTLAGLVIAIILLGVISYLIDTLDLSYWEDKFNTQSLYRIKQLFVVVRFAVILMVVTAYKLFEGSPSQAYLFGVQLFLTGCIIYYVGYKETKRESYKL